MNLPPIMYKFGITTFPDVLTRFKAEVHYSRGWRSIPLSRDYDIKVIWSRWTTKKEGLAAEKWFRDTYPKNFYCSEPYNGIKECRVWTYNESCLFKATLLEKFPKSEIHTWEAKIYYIQLTLK